MKPARHQPAVPLLEEPHHEPVPYAWRWTMRNELSFLRDLGRWRQRESVPDRAQLLRGYLEGLARRRRWTDLQREPLECEARFLSPAIERGARGMKLAFRPEGPEVIVYLAHAHTMADALVLARLKQARARRVEHPLR